ncbi:transmembrane protein 207 [Hyla sarda]|uniref:transmembrane protein 207 n=1 Tax=Hyla sarda TaxID=327740 RepID=UPI0024C26C00|nr:transmembrane protein 207 [Hyla sarda]
MRFKTVCAYFLNPVNGLVYFAFPQPTCSSLCDLSEICVSYIEQPLSVWYIWIFLLVLLILMVHCVAACCLQCHVKRQERFSSRKTITVVTLSGSESIHVTESSQCPHLQSWSSHQTADASVSSVSLGELELGAPPSYEELFINRKFLLQIGGCTQPSTTMVKANREKEFSDPEAAPEMSASNHNIPPR